MNSTELTLSIYPNATDDFHIYQTKNTSRAEKWHFHNYYQIYFISSGLLTHYYANRSDTMGKGDSFIIPPNQCHRIAATDGTTFYTISFNLSFLGGSGKNEALFDFLYRLIPGNRNSILVRPKVTLDAFLRQPFEELCHLMVKEFESCQYANMDVLRGLLLALIALLSRAYHTLLEMPTYTSELVEAKQAVLHYVDKMKAKYTQPLTLANASQETLLSRSLFCRIFHELTGTTFKQYLNRLRISHATELILTTDDSFSDIAQMSGFNEFSTFYRNFRNYIGISPAYYKKICGFSKI